METFGVFLTVQACPSALNAMVLGKWTLLMRKSL